MLSKWRRFRTSIVKCETTMRSGVLIADWNWCGDAVRIRRILLMLQRLLSQKCTLNCIWSARADSQPCRFKPTCRKLPRSYDWFWQTVLLGLCVLSELLLPYLFSNRPDHFGGGGMNKIHILGVTKLLNLQADLQLWNRGWRYMAVVTYTSTNELLIRRAQNCGRKRRQKGFAAAAGFSRMMIRKEEYYSTTLTYQLECTLKAGHRYQTYLSQLWVYIRTLTWMGPLASSRLWLKNKYKTCVSQFLNICLYKSFYGYTKWGCS